MTMAAEMASLMGSNSVSDPKKSGSAPTAAPAPAITVNVPAAITSVLPCRRMRVPPFGAPFTPGGASLAVTVRLKRRCCLQKSLQISPDWLEIVDELAGHEGLARRRHALVHGA